MQGPAPQAGMNLVYFLVKGECLMEPFRPADRDKIDRSHEPQPHKAPELPDEMKLIIARYLGRDVDSLKALRLTDRGWSRIVDDRNVLPLDEYRQVYPEIFDSLEQLPALLEKKPKRRWWSKITAMITRTPETEPEKVKPQESTLPYRAQLAAAFFDELARLCKDYEIPFDESLVDKKETALISPPIVASLRQQIKQKQDLALCHFCRLALEEHVKLAETLDDPEAARGEAERWREKLENTPPLEKRLLAINNHMTSFPQFLHIPPEIKHFSNLESISTIYMNIKSLPPEIGRLPRLEYIKLTMCDIKTLPPQIGNLAKLKRLEIINGYDYFNEPSKIKLPKQILNCQSLETLKLYPMDFDDAATAEAARQLKQRGVNIK